MAKKTLKASDLIVKENFPDNSVSKRVAPIRPEPDEIIEGRSEMVETPKRPRIKQDRVARGMVKKKSLSHTIAKTFFNESSNNVVHHVVQDVLVPAAKNTISEMFQTFIEMLLFGETRSRSKDRDKDRTTISYDRMYGPKRRERKLAIPRGDNFDLDEIYFRNGDDAADVLERMCDELEKYEVVSVKDYFEFAGIDGATWVHDKWGWTDLRRARCTHTRHGYAIMLPDPEELD